MKIIYSLLMWPSLKKKTTTFHFKKKKGIHSINNSKILLVILITAGIYIYFPNRPFHTTSPCFLPLPPACKLAFLSLYTSDPFLVILWSLDYVFSLLQFWWCPVPTFLFIPSLTTLISSPNSLIPFTPFTPVCTWGQTYLPKSPCHHLSYSKNLSWALAG